MPPPWPAGSSTQPVPTWPQRVQAVTAVWDTATPQPTARLTDPQTSDPSSVIPELAGFGRLGLLRRETLRNQTYDRDIQISPIIAEQAAGAYDPNVGLNPLTQEQTDAVPHDVVEATANMSALQQHAADVTARQRETRRRNAVRRLAAAMHSGYQPGAYEEPETPQTPRSSEHNLVCAICQENVDLGQEVVVLRCAHQYHGECLDIWIAHHVAEERFGDASCPQCRGPLDGMNRRPRGTSAEQGEPEYHHLGTPDTQTSWAIAADVLPWWPTEGARETQVYEHSATQIPGKLSIIVDSGAWTNLVGAKLVKSFAQKAIQAGHVPTSKRMNKPLSIQGVGNGAQSCEWEVQCPVAVPNDSGTAGLGSFTAPVVQGSGEGLPALLGLRSMEQQRAILDTGNRELILPGPGDIEITLPPGSVRVPLEKAPSGHLVMVIDQYRSVEQTKGGLQTRTPHFLARTSKSDKDANKASPSSCN